jgi:hypothetical protein
MPENFRTNCPFTRAHCVGVQCQMWSLSAPHHEAERENQVEDGAEGPIYMGGCALRLGMEALTFMSRKGDMIA